MKGCVLYRFISDFNRGKVNGNLTMYIYYHNAVKWWKKWIVILYAYEQYIQGFLDKFTPGGTIKQANLSKCEFKETWIQSF
jgi:hypothetical protein